MTLAGVLVRQDSPISFHCVFNAAELQGKFLAIDRDLFQGRVIVRRLAEAFPCLD